MNLPKEYRQKQQELHDLQVVHLNGVEIHVSEFPDQSITPDMITDMRMNSYAQDVVPPKLSDEALIQRIESQFQHCPTPSFPCTTYEESLLHILLPELLARFKTSATL